MYCLLSYVCNIKSYHEIAPTAKPSASSAASCCFLSAQADQATQASFLLSLTWLVDYYETACLEGTIKLQACQVKRLIWLACWKVWP
jgi:hypothetical protein